MRLSAFVAVAFAVLLAGCPTAAPPCGPSTCTGCCDTSGACQSGLTTQACGTAGATCSACSVSDTCSFGKCMVSGFNQGGGAAGGFTGGGVAGDGGQGGGTTGGGSAGGGTAGGSSAGGSADAGTPDAGAPDAGQPNPCAGTLTFCSTRCLDLSADPENCGACGRLCGQGQVCNRGQCAVLPDDCTASGMGCGAGFFCDPVTKRCLTGCRLTSDCPMGATCGSGTCSCPTGEHACGQSCVSNDAVASCGNRCSTCAQPANSTATCTASACGFTCASGYRDNGGACLDIDECLTGNGGCSTNAACANTPGSRTCTCNAGYTGDGVTCTDVNECVTNNGGCDVNAGCTNTPGARTCACNGGFTGNGVTCADVNECTTNNGGCAAQATCTNTPGARTCACNTGFTGTGLVCADVNECLTNNGGCSANGSCTNTPGARSCACNAGYMGDGVTCSDVNECLSGNGGCDTNAACSNTTGSRTCTCNSGFSGTGLTCADVNECLTNNGGCASTVSGGACTNTPGSRTCACATGFTGNGFTCADVNECLTSNGGCAAVASGGVCTNTQGSRTCSCTTGYSGTGLTCADINECLTNNGGCAAVASGGACTNTPGSRTCACATGFTGDGFSCADVNECLTNNGGCAAVASGGACTNTPGSRTCACTTGFTGDGFSCADVNECLTSNGGCSVNATCTNTAGSRTCACNAGYAGNGITCTPSGDTCSAPISLTASVAANGSTVGAVNDYSGPASALCGGQTFPGPDVVYSFTPGATSNYRATALGSGFSPNVYALSTCGALASCVASGAAAFNFHGTAGSPVFLTVDSTASGVAGPFSLTVTPVTAPVNDLCTSPTVMTVSVPQTGTFLGAVNDVVPTAGCSAGFAGVAQPDVVYTFTPATSGLYAFRETTGADVVMWVGTACNGSCLSLTDEPEQFTVSLTGGQTSFFVVEPYSSATSFTVVVEAITVPSNDLCAAAQPLTASVVTNGSTLGAANESSGFFSAICGGGSALSGPDVFYSFTPAATQNYLVTTTGSLFTPFTSVSSTCAAPATCSSVGAVPISFHGTAGTPVLITVDSQTITEAGNYSITVAPVTAPPNDLCSNPTPMTLATPVSGTFVGSVNDLNPTPACSAGFASGGLADVFYSFTPATSGIYAFRETTSSDVVMWVGAACDGSCLNLADEPEQFTVSLTGGQTYFFVVEPYSSATSFTVIVEAVTVPTNDVCAGAQPLTASAVTNGTTLGAANDNTGPFSAICGGGTGALPGADVFYSFTPAATQNYLVTTSASLFSAFTYVSSTCGLPTTCSSIGGVPISFHGTAGTPVFIAVDSPGPTATGAFSISVAPVTAPTNDLCSNPRVLTIGTPATGTFVGAVNDLNPTPVCNSGFAGAALSDVFFSFTPATSGTYTFQETSGADVVMWVGTACNGSCLGLVDEPEQLSVALTAGQTYFLVVEPYSTATSFTVVVN